MLNTSAITSVTKSSMKPQSGTTANRHLCSSGEKNGKQRRTKLKLMMRGLELQRLAKRHISGRSDAEQSRNHAHSLSGYRVMLSEGIR